MTKQWWKRMVSALAGLAVALTVFVGKSLGVEAAAGHNVTYNTIHIYVDNAQQYIEAPSTCGLTVFDLDGDSINIASVDINYSSVNGEWSIEAHRGGIPFDSTHRYTFTTFSFQFGNGYVLNIQDHPLVLDNGNLVASSNDNAGGNGGQGHGHSHSSDGGEGMHVHDFKWDIVVQPTFYEEGIQALQCADCGFIDKTSQQPVPRQSAIMAKNEQLVLNATAGETVVLDFFDHFSVNRYFIEKLMAHNDAAYEIHFRHKSVNYVIKVPAGFDWAATLDQNGWSGFLYVRTFPGVEKIAPAE